MQRRSKSYEKQIFNLVLISLIVLQGTGLMNNCIDTEVQKGSIIVFVKQLRNDNGEVRVTLYNSSNSKMLRTFVITQNLQSRCYSQIAVLKGRQIRSLPLYANQSDGYIPAYVSY
jgi:hypothetical protein